MKTDLFQSCGHRWVFQICWHIECSTFTASSFRIWNSSTGIPSPPLALFLVMLPKAHLPSHSSMSGSRWVITHHDYLGREDLFCIVLCILPCLFNVFRFCLVHNISVLYWTHLCMKCSLSISNYLEEMSSFPQSIVFLYFFAMITEKGFLISPCFSLELWFKWVYLSFSPLPFTSLLSTAICKASSDSHLASLHFFFLGMILLFVSCTMSWTSVLQTLCLSDLTPWIYFSLPLYN